MCNFFKKSLVDAQESPVVGTPDFSVSKMVAKRCRLKLYQVEKVSVSVDNVHYTSKYLYCYVHKLLASVMN